MKLASVKSGRDGQLVVVSQDVSRYCVTDEIAPTMRDALDDWAQVELRLRERAARLDSREIVGESCADADFAAPLPRSAAWLDGSTFINHVRLMNRSLGMEMKPEMTETPLMYQGGSDDLLGPRDPILLAEDERWGIDLEAELGIVTDDVPMQTSAADALAHVKLLVLINDVSLRLLQPREFALGFGMLQAKPSTAFAPFAVTPDEFGGAWSAGRLDIVMHSRVNSKPLGQPASGSGMLYGFADLIAHATRTRRLSAGTIIGSGTISNEQPVENARIEEGGVGFSCLSEARAVDMIRSGKPETPFLRFGDRIKIEAEDRNGESPFGAIDQQIMRFER